MKYRHLAFLNGFLSHLSMFAKRDVHADQQHQRDITIKLPVHIKDEIAMKEMTVSAVQDSHGLDLI